MRKLLARRRLPAGKGRSRPTACRASSRRSMPGPSTLGVYFMYDVKHYDPTEWSSPPLEGRLVDRPEGKAMVGRGAVNQKGPETAFLAALHAFRAAGRKLPVNLVLVAEGEEEIASPHFPQIVTEPEVRAALEKRSASSFPAPARNRRQRPRSPWRQGRGRAAADLERRKMGTRAGEGHPFEPKANVDSPVWHLIKALNTLVSEDGQTPAIDGWFENVKPLTARQKELIAADVAAGNEADDMKVLGHQALVQGRGLSDRLLPAGVAADGQHPGTGQRLYGPGRQDRPARTGGGQDRPSAGARHDQGRGGVEAQGAPRQARLWRHRGQRQRRLRPDPDRREQPADQGRAGDAGGGRDPDTIIQRVGGSLAGRVFTGPPLHCRQASSAAARAAAPMRPTNGC